jgi:hypothetical protein
MTLPTQKQLDEFINEYVKKHSEDRVWDYAYAHTAIARMHVCDLSSAKIVYVDCTNGTRQYWKQCQECKGVANLGGPIAYKKLTDTEMVSAIPKESQVDSGAWIRDAYQYVKNAVVSMLHTEFSQHVAPSLPDAFKTVIRDSIVQYSEYINSPHWKSIRDSAMDEVNWRCQECSYLGDDVVAVHVHHLTYAHLGYERPYELVPLCKKHHDEIHRRTI